MHMKQTEVRLPQELTLLGSMLRMGADMTLKRVTRDVAVREANERMKLRREMMGLPHSSESQGSAMPAPQFQLPVVE